MNKTETPKIALITPVKDEMHNLETFFETLAGQNIPIFSLTIVENNSTDGSKEYLQQRKAATNVTHFRVVHKDFKDSSYDLEFKYAEIIKEGLDTLQAEAFYPDVAYIGILDSDVFPEERYYDKLTTYFDQNPQVGLTSGLLYTPEGKQHMASPDFVGGANRLWRKECLEQSGFPIAPSPDSITVALAEIEGWKATTDKSAKAFSREVGVRMKSYKTFGSRLYYRGSTPFFALLKSAHYAFAKGKFKMAWDNLVGYFECYFSKSPRIEDKRVIRYYRRYLTMKLKGFFR